MKRIMIAWAIWIAVAGRLEAQPNSQPNPYRTVEHWFTLPEGRTMGSSSAVLVAPDGHIWIAERCGANSCADSSLPPVLEFDPSGKLLSSFGANLFVFPHGKELKKPEKIDLEQPLKVPPVAVNGVLYVNNGATLYAIAAK